MKIITKLTDEQIARFDEWSRKWIDIGLSTEPADFARFKEAIKVAYSKADIGWHNNIVHVQSPIVGAFAAPIASLIINRDISNDAVGDAVRDAVGDAVHGAVHVAVHVAVGGAVRDAVHGAVGVAVRDAVHDAVGAAVGAAVHCAVHDAVHCAVHVAVHCAVRDAVGGAVGVAVGAAVRDAVHDAVHDKWFDYIGGQFWVGGWCGSPAYVSFFTDVCGLRLSDDIQERILSYRAICESVNWYWPHTQFVIVCDRPRIINCDAEGRLHCENGSSIEYRDGWSLYHWHGVAVPKEWVTGEPPSAKEALTWQNIEQRRAAAEIVGWQNILSELNANVIDKDVEPEVGTLLEADIPDSGKERFLQVKCGTGRIFCLPVPREMQTALEANCWTYGIDADRNYLPEVRT